MARLETINTGKAMRESRWDMADVARVFRYYADLADKDTGRLVDPGNPAALSRIVYEPVGVCGLIGPWNYPLLQLSWKIAPALAAGNTAVMKPAQVTPLTAIHLTRLLEEAGVPAGVVNLVLGPGGRVGQALADSPDVDLISLTGGHEAGRALMSAAARTRSGWATARTTRPRPGRSSPPTTGPRSRRSSRPRWPMVPASWRAAVDPPSPISRPASSTARPSSPTFARRCGSFATRSSVRS